MPLVPPRRLVLSALALLLSALAAVADGPRPGDVRERGDSVESAGRSLSWLAEEGSERDGSADREARCVLQSVFDAVDGVEHVGTGAWLELELLVDRAQQGEGEVPSAWGARLADWHHETSFWIVRDGLDEGVLLSSGTARTPWLPLDVARWRHYRLLADETGARLQVDGLTVLELPLEPRVQPGGPAAILGTGRGELEARALEARQGCLRPVGARVLSRAPDGSLRVALLGRAGFRPGASVDEGSLRAGGLPARSGSLQERDVDADGHLDLVAEFPPSRSTGGVVRVEARGLEGERFQGWDLLAPTRSRSR